MIHFLCAVVCLVNIKTCAVNRIKADTIPLKYDSSILQNFFTQDAVASNAVLLDEEERGSITNSIAPLNGEKEIFLQMAAFQFSAMRYRYRGYDASLSATVINGLWMNDLHQGNPAWSLWSGLSQVMRNSIDYTSNRLQDNWLGDPGITTCIDMRASAQRKQLQWGYATSNRNYTNRYHFSLAKETNSKGWSWAIAFNMRIADETYRIGCNYRSTSYYVAVDKQLKNAGIISCIVFGASQQYGKQAGITTPVANLFGTQYNPNWGYQQGQKRNAAMVNQHLPACILMHQLNLNNRTIWETSFGVITGKRTDTGLDWYQAADPRPDYYRYLPEFQDDSVLRIQVKDILLEQESLQQINWQHFYSVNRNSLAQIEQINGSNESIRGKRAHYLLDQKTIHTQKFQFSSTYRSRLNNSWNIATGIQYSYQQNHYYKTVFDLLGADFYVNWNQFAETVFPSTIDVKQFDLDKPNRILYKGDKYGYDYLSSISFSNIWAQSAYTGNKIDLLLALRLSKTEFLRKGLVRNGLFPNQSKGKSPASHFFNPLAKLGILFKLNPKSSIGFLMQVLSKAPQFDNVFISPRMRNTKQENPVSEQVLIIETNYKLLLRKYRVGISFYHTNIRNGMNVLTFYHDGYQQFVNYAIRNINRQYTGIESSLSFELNEQLEFALVFAKGFHRYTSRQMVTVSLDNNESLLDKMEVYSQNFRVAGSPMQVSGISFKYRTNNGLLVQLNGSHFQDQWLEFNPLRRTYELLDGIVKGSEQWYKIISQQKLPTTFLMNMFIGKGFSIKKFYQRTPLRLFCSLSINNLLNKQGIITGGYEQLRFDQEMKDPDKFPPKLFYGYGLNYALSITISL